MKYILLIYANEAQWENRSEADAKAMLAEYGELARDLQRSGRMRGGDRLQPTATATTVRVREGKTLTTDGPFAETKEQLGGYFLIEAKDLDDALAVAARVPGARTGSVEVRPIFEM